MTNYFQQLFKSREDAMKTPQSKILADNPKKTVESRRIVEQVLGTEQTVVVEGAVGVFTLVYSFLGEAVSGLGCYICI